MIARAGGLLQRKFIRDTLTLQTGQFFVIAIAGLTQAILARGLGVDRLGFYTTVVTQFALLGTFEISGAALIIKTLLAKALGANDADAAREQLAWFVKVAFLSNGLLVFGFFIAFSLYGGEAGQLTRWLAFTRLLDLPFAVVTLSQSARRSMRRVVQLETARLIVGSVLTIAAVFTLRVEAIIAAQLVTSALFCALGVYRYPRFAREDARLPSLPVLLCELPRVPLRRYMGQGVLFSIDKNLSAFTVEILPFLILSAWNKIDLAYLAIAYKVITYPGPFITGFARNLESYLPFKTSQGASLRAIFIRATLASSLLWSAGTVALAFVAPFVLLGVFGVEYAPAIGWMYPLLLQSLAVGLGVGLGTAFRTLNKPQHSIVESIIVTILLLPIGVYLIMNYGGYGAAWYIGLSWLLNAVAGIGVVLWLTRKQR